MKLLSSLDEMLLLAIISLGVNAYGVTIRRILSDVTEKEWSFGAVYDPLYRLEQKGYVKSCLSDPTAERGGRSKRLFEVTKNGVEVLKEHQKIRFALGSDSADLLLNKG